MTLIIGLLGPAGAGKSTVAAYLEQRYGAVRYAFATPLKRLVQGAFDLTHEQVYGTQSQKEAPDERYGGKSSRWFQQRIGEEARHVFGEDFWIERTLANIEADAPTLAVIEDVRYVNESRAVKSKRHGYVWRLESAQRDTVADATHPSELQWQNAPHDLIIAPTQRGLEHLYALVDGACHAYRIERKHQETP